MKSLYQSRLAVLRVLLAALVLFGGVSAWVSASSLPKAGYTGQALAARAMLHSPASKASPTWFQTASKWRHSDDGRYLADGTRSPFASPKPFIPASNPNPIIVDEAVQTFDVFLPPPTFSPNLTSNGTAVTPTGLLPTNLTPVWSPDETFLVFSSNRDVNGNIAADGHFHIWAVSATGGSVTQVTSGPGNEFWPTLDTTSPNPIMAFTSDANSPGNQQLYIIGTAQSGIPFTPGQAAINVATLGSNVHSALTLGDTDFTNVQHPTLSPGSDRVAFSATTATTSLGHVTGVSHIYYLYTSNNGYNPQPSQGQFNPPAQLTDGPAGDTDPAWSPDGLFIAFSSTATSIANSNLPTTPTPAPNGPIPAPTVTAGTGANRGIFLITGNSTGNSNFGQVPANLAGTTGRVTLAGGDDFGPAWSSIRTNRYFNPNGTLEYLAFARGGSPTGAHDIYYFRLINDQAGASQADQNPVNRPITVETSGTVGTNNAVVLNTNNTAGFDNEYPTWAPFQSVFSIAYQAGGFRYNYTTNTLQSIFAGRSVAYYIPGTNLPTETPTNLPDGANGVGATYTGILESQVINLDPPSLLRYSGNEVIHVSDANGNTTRNIQPSVPGGAASQVKFVVRLSSREAGVNNTGGPNGGPNVFMQIKDPDSKYQDSQGLEHKVFANCNDIEQDPAGSGQTLPLGSGTSLTLFNAGGTVGTTTVNGTTFGQTGAIGGWDPVARNTISVGHATFATNQNGVITSNQSTDFTLTGYRPWGPEYECQYVNPTVANPGTNPGDYGVPYYLAGIDDDVVLSGQVIDPTTGTVNPALSHPPRPIVNNPNAADFRDQYAQWIQLSRLPDAQQDGQGGVLYGTTYNVPVAGSDFYLDVIAYDNAVFPNIEAFPATTTAIGFRGHSENWRIYDNVGGFTTTTFNGNNDILVVIDNGLGQKFSFTTFGQGRNSNLIPSLYGAESYYTDVDINLLPNAIDFALDAPAPTPPNAPAPVQGAPTPTRLTATPGAAQVTLTWAGSTNAASYNIYRSLTPTVPSGPGVTPIATTTQPTTTFFDTNVVNGTAYYYVVTFVDSNGNESGPSNTATATPQNFGNAPFPVIQKLSVLAGSPYTDVQNGLGVNSYLGPDDGGRIDATGAQLPSGNTTAPYVRAQKYSIWRILSRGPIPQSILAGYQPTFQAQPAVADTVNRVNVAAAANVPVANRCVIWVSPYTGELPLVDAGSLENPTTQQTLQNYVNTGGRLCITGANVAGALSLQNPNSTNAFLATLGAKFATTAGGSVILAGAGQRISGFSGGPANFPVFQDGGSTVNTPPSGGPLLLSNDETFASTNRRDDGSPDQLQPFTLFNSIAKINTIAPLAGKTLDMTTNGAPGLIYDENFATNADGTPAAGYGSRIVFGSFGLEGIGFEFYRYTINSTAFFAVRNQRSHILFNIVNYLRSGAITGRVTQANGSGVGGAIVYTRGGNSPGPRTLFSAVTNFDGTFTISGVEPGTYTLTTYKAGFTTTTSNISFSVLGDNTTTATSLVIQPVPPGSLKGTVTDSVTGVGVGNVTVTFKSTDGQVTVSAVTGPDGTYNIDNVPAGTYNGTASKQPQYADATAPTQTNPITVLSGAAAQADFTIAANPAVISGNVFQDLSGDNQFNPNSGEGIAGATLTFTPTAGTAPAPVTSGADGAYTISLAPGTYTVTVSAPGFQTNTSQTVTAQAGIPQTRNIQLSVGPPVIPGFLGGLVTNSADGSPIAGATITVTGGTLTAPVTITTSGTTTAPNAPTGDGQPLNYGPQSLPPGTYTVAVSAPGYTAPASVTTTISSNAFTRVDFTSANGNALTPLHVFGPGYNFFSTPYDYAAAGVSFDQIFGPLNTGTFNPFAPVPSNANRSHVFAWSPVLLQYVLDPAPPADGAHLGQGYWVFLHSAHAVTVAGNSPTTATIPVGLHRGWNQIGVPSVTAITTGRLSFANPTGAGAISFAQAGSTAYHLVSPTLYGYNGSSYVAVTATTAMQPWQAYWIYAFTDTTLLIPTGGG